jgi:hypothetical protein
MYSPEIQAKITTWRARANGQGDPLSSEEYQEIIKLLRSDRVRASATSATAQRKRAKAEIPSGDDLLNEAMGL